MANKVDEVKGNTLPVQLSGNDQTAPDTHASIYNILTNKNLAALNSNFKMDLTAVRTLRYRAFNEIKNIFDKEATNDYPRYWNRNVKNFTVTGLNLFANNIGLQPNAS